LHLHELRHDQHVIDVAVQEPGMNRVGEYKRNPLDSSVTKVGKNLYKSL